MSVVTSALLEQYVEEVKKIYGERLRSVILYGSYARGDFRPDSDIDIMILVVYRGANNRAYYAIYHAILAVQALDGKSYKRHKDTLANFHKDYVRTEIFPETFGRRIARAEQIRHASDYDDFYVATKEKAEEQIETADELIQEIEMYCQIRQKNIVALNK